MSRFRYSAILPRSASLSPCDVGRRADQALLLGAPEREAHRVGHRRRPAELHRGLQQRRRPRAVVVDPRPVRHRVQVRAGEHHLVGVAGAGLGDHVAAAPLLDRGVQHERHRRPGPGEQRVAVGPAEPRGGHGPVAPSPRVPSDSGPSALLTTSTAAAPAVAATVDFWANVQVPRRTRTTEPAGTPASAAASQPLAGRDGQRRGDAAGRGGGGVAQRRRRHLGAGHGQLCSCAENRRAANSGVSTVYPASAARRPRSPRSRRSRGCRAPGCRRSRRRCVAAPAGAGTPRRRSPPRPAGRAAPDPGPAPARAGPGPGSARGPAPSCRP